MKIDSLTVAARRHGVGMLDAMPSGGMVLIALASVSLCACQDAAQMRGEARALPITAGAVDHEHTSVGMLQLASLGAQPWCTATLIGERTAVTAAHCLRPGQQHRIVLQDHVYGVDGVVQHPSWTLDEPGDVHDLGLVLLSEAPPVVPSPISGVAPRVDDTITLVGYGTTTDDGTDDGQRRAAVNTISDLTESQLFISGSGDGMGNICAGDSGGPAFVRDDGREYLVGVASGGVPPCGTLAWHTRVDRYHSWITSEAGGDIYDPTVGALAGAYCDVNDHCASGICAALDDQTFCAKPCAPDSSCDPGTHCMALANTSVCVPTVAYASSRGAVGVLVGGCSLSTGTASSGAAHWLTILLAIGLIAGLGYRRETAGRR